jgi:hypothetical protein
MEGGSVSLALQDTMTIIVAHSFMTWYRGTSGGSGLVERMLSFLEMSPKGLCGPTKRTSGLPDCVCDFFLKWGLIRFQREDLIIESVTPLKREIQATSPSSYRTSHPIPSPGAFPEGSSPCFPT